MKKILLLAALLSASTCLFAGNKAKDSKTHFAYDVLAPYVESGELPGAITVFYNDGVQETCCIGYVDARTKRKIKLNSAFMQCSQTKGFCGVTVAKLVEEGKLSLDDPVSKYLPEFKNLMIYDSSDSSTMTLRNAKNVLTLRMVLNHTGGFPFETCAKRNDIRGGGWSGGAPLRQNAVVAASMPLMFEPGTQIQYSNTGIDIAAAVVEVVTGMKWEDYLKQEVLDPLGMKDTWFWPTDRQIRNKIELYTYIENAPAQWEYEAAWQQRPYNDSHVFASAGAGLWTTVRDQLKFYKMLMNLGVGENGVRILKEETVKNLLAVSQRPADMVEGYSLGLVAPVVDDEDQWFGHGGAWATSCSVNWHTKQLTLFVVQTLGGPQPWREEVEKNAWRKFYGSVTNNSAIDSYTGRTE